MVVEAPALTEDSLFGGKVVIHQQRDGYRFSIDAVLLAGLTRVKPGEKVIDLGTGCGAAALIMAAQTPGLEITGVEIQEELAELAERNVAVNSLSGRIAIVGMDFRKISERFSPESYDLVVSNPPYRKLDAGRTNPHRQRAIARHEICASVEDVAAAGKHLLPRGGRLAVIYPAARLDHLLATVRQYGFRPKRLTVIYSSVESPARLVHVECRKGGGEELTVAPAFFIYGGRNEYSEAMRELYRLRGGDLEGAPD
mgnify:FL=1